MNNNIPQMPFPFCLFNMNGSAPQEGQNENGNPSPFGSMMQMPFMFGGMPQMPFPFTMPGRNTTQGGEQQQNQNPTSFPFFGMPQMPFMFGCMPQMPVPFTMPGMNLTPGGEQQQNQNPASFPLFFMPQMPFMFGGMPQTPFAFPFNKVGKKAEDGKIELPPQLTEWLKGLLSSLLNMESTPEGLENLQKVLDFIFSLIPMKEESPTAEEN